MSEDCTAQPHREAGAQCEDRQAGGSRFLGIDIGAETLTVSELHATGNSAVIGAVHTTQHGKSPRHAIRKMLATWDLTAASGLAVTGRLHHAMDAEPVPTPAALRRGVRILYPGLDAVTVVSVGARGYSVLELAADDRQWFAQNPRCSQGTGNFLSQLVRRFGMSVAEAAAWCRDEERPAPLSGRCPVILKTDMTHLANVGEDHRRILAGLFDAVCENVVALMRPRIAPRDVVLIGGVTRSERIRRNIAAWLEARDMYLVEAHPLDHALEALGAAGHALEHGSDHPTPTVDLDILLEPALGRGFDTLPALNTELPNVTRLKAPATCSPDRRRPVLLGLDIGSTGSKAVAVGADDGEPVWHSYLATRGEPVAAAQQLVARWLESPGGSATVLGCGVTGSGREVVGSLLESCCPPGSILVMNEIAAHARGAVAVDPAVDTIFEIGGQDAKYIRLENGRVVDAAMNEACSAGTGSFIAEQGELLADLGQDLATLDRSAIGAAHGVALGQHCSVFMAEAIDEAVAQGAAADAIAAGLYDAVMQNYLNRVKGSRPVGERIFCQGMPFSSDALAAAAARHSGRPVVVPPNPGTPGAFGIALLLRDRIPDGPVTAPGIDLSVFLRAEMSATDEIVCRARNGCDGGNRCRIKRLTTVVDGVEQRFLWGGACSLYDRGTRPKALPHGAPDPFRQREELIATLLSRHASDEDAPTVAFTDIFALNGLAPLLAVFLGGLGFSCRALRSADATTLKRGIETARVPFCAPMQMLHGAALEMVESGAELVLLPRLRALPRVRREPWAELCPVALASPDVVGGVLPDGGPEVLRPEIDLDCDGYDGEMFRASMRDLAGKLGRGDRWRTALDEAVAAQRELEAGLLRIGADALAFCAGEDVVPVAVLGRPYTIHNRVLNANVPSLLRSLGALPIPVDCLPVDDHIPVLENLYWGHGQRNVRAARHVRRTPGLYSVFCSNYACGPDSFTLHHYAYAMQGKPYAVVETDGHSGDAGTRTRMEAFLYCVDEDRQCGASRRTAAPDLDAVLGSGPTMHAVRTSKTRLLIPRMGANAEVIAATLRADGFDAAPAPPTTPADLELGRRATSGKECAPLVLTLGTLLGEAARTAPDEQLALFMPTAHGPCRFGAYCQVHRIALERAGLGHRVTVVSADDTDYFREMSGSFTARAWLGFVCHDLLEAMLLHVRPVEREAGAAERIYREHLRELVAAAGAPLATRGGSLAELAGGVLRTRRQLLRAARQMAAARNGRSVPTVSLVGEIYMRLDPVGNGRLIEELETRGLRVHLAPFVEWLEYTTHLAERRVNAGRTLATESAMRVRLRALLQRATLGILHRSCAGILGWRDRASVAHILEAAAPFVQPELRGEAPLTVGAAILEYQHGVVDGAVIVGPHECMPCRIAEAQLGKAAEELGLPSVFVAATGDPLDGELLDRFAYEIRERHRERLRNGAG